MDNPKSIAELWIELEALDRSASLCNPSGKYPTDVRDEMQRTLDKLIPKIQALRSELLERCKELEDDAAICVTVAEFEVVQEDDQAFIERDMLAITLSGPFAAEPSKLREFAAILNFWAWELEQRAKEVSNG